MMMKSVFQVFLVFSYSVKADHNKIPLSSIQKYINIHCMIQSISDITQNKSSFLTSYCTCLILIGTLFNVSSSTILWSIFQWTTSDSYRMGWNNLWRGITIFMKLLLSQFNYTAGRIICVSRHGFGFLIIAIYEFLVGWSKIFESWTWYYDY